MRRLFLIFPLFLFVLCVTSPASSTENTEEQALSILKAMTEYVSGQRVIALTFDSGIEVITPQLEKLQFSNSDSLDGIEP
ncbi:hypothetical protein [Desulfosediminicola sp.]|uniref:hypothetical protein n=1 Tax=Desulfosediminicola sp. TaxID=2886825 RepID=UPI003AF254F1